MVDILVLIEKSCIKMNNYSWGCTTVVERDPHMHKVLGLMPSTTQKGSVSNGVFLGYLKCLNMGQEAGGFRQIFSWAHPSYHGP